MITLLNSAGPTLVQTGLPHVEVNTAAGKVDSTEKKDLEDACHDENRRKFSHISNTPLIHIQIYQEVGFNNTSDSRLKIM